MYKRSILKYLIAVFLLIIVGGFYYLKHHQYYKISASNVKAIWCTSCNKDGERKIQVQPTDKDIIISEISKMKSFDFDDEIGTIGYSFTIQLVDGTEFSLYENTKKSVTIRKDDSYKNIEAPKTADFINRFLTENNIER